MPAFDAVANVAPGTGGSFTISITVPAGNPVLMVGIGLSSTTETVSSVSWSLGGGTPVEIKTVRLNASFASVWAIPNPGIGAGIITVTLSSSVPFQGAAETFTAADQTTPCPISDAISASGTDVTQLIVTPTNLSANDASFAVGVNTVADDPSGVSQNDRFKNATTAVNLQVGDSVGTAALSANWTLSGSLGKQVAIGVRIVPPSAAPPSPMVVAQRRLVRAA